MEGNMAGYWLSFTLAEKTIDGRNHNQRWDDLYEAIHAIAESDYWEKTTSFIVFDVNKTLDQVTAIAKNAVAPTYDLVLIRSLDTRNARIFGPNDDDDIFQLMPYLKKA
jgi:hypothetical protein